MTQMTTPQIREELAELAAQQIAIGNRIAFLSGEMYRRFFGRVPSTSRRVTKGLRGAVCAYAASNPDVSHQEIATLFDVNLGRVSEILHGKRGG